MAFWETVQGTDVAQGDYLVDIDLPIIGPELLAAEGDLVLNFQTYDAVVLSNTCDLLNKKLTTVTLVVCGIASDALLLSRRKDKDLYNEILKGRRANLYILPSPFDTNDKSRSLLLDFQKVETVSLGYVERHAQNMGNRHRLLTPYVEHMSQAFGGFFSRVALPIDRPQF